MIVEETNGMTREDLTKLDMTKEIREEPGYEDDSEDVDKIIFDYSQAEERYEAMKEEEKKEPIRMGVRVEANIPVRAPPKITEESSEGDMEVKVVPEDSSNNADATVQ